MDVRRRGRGALDFGNISKKGCFLSFEWEKTNFTIFGPPLEKLWKNYLEAPRKKSFRCPNVGLY